MAHPYQCGIAVRHQALRIDAGAGSFVPRDPERREAFTGRPGVIGNHRHRIVELDDLANARIERAALSSTPLTLLAVAALHNFEVEPCLLQCPACRCCFECLDGPDRSAADGADRRDARASRDVVDIDGMPIFEL